MTSDVWNPSQYGRFRDERSQPFYDLLALVRIKPAMRVVDLGSGTGELTRVLHDRLRALETVGIDQSRSMLAEAAKHSGGGLRFQLGDIAEFESKQAPDLIFSNAALQWVDDHPSLLARLAAAVDADGQLAVQVPANFGHPSHLIAAETAAVEPFASAIKGSERIPPVLEPEAYAELLDGLGFRDQHVRLQVYGHHLRSTEDVVEWVKGTFLTDYQRRLPQDLFPEFVRSYRESLFRVIGLKSPYFYPFKRILLWGQR